MQTTGICITCPRGLSHPVLFSAAATLLSLAGLSAQTVPPPPAPGSAPALTQSIQLPTIVVVGNLDSTRQQIVPSLGATVYTLDQQEIENQSQGENVPFSKLVLRLPGVSRDSAASGSFHVRDEHANVQYRINDVLIPESITSFGSQFDTRFADHVDLITGALPAQYGFRTSGILDIHTKSGAFYPGGDVEMYGGSNGTIQPSFQYGGSQGRLDYYLSGNYLQNHLGIENPTSSSHALHDGSDQYRGFAYLSYIIDDTSRLSLIAGEAYNQYHIPNTPGLPGGTDPEGTSFSAALGGGSFNSGALNESQREQNNFEVLAYQKTIDDFHFQISTFDSYSKVHFTPDQTGDLYFNGIAGTLDRSVLSTGLQFDSSYNLSEAHTLRAGLLLNAQGSTQTASTSVFPTALNPTTGNDDLTGAGPISFLDHDYTTAYSYGIYIQDEWKITKALTLNYGGRFDLYQSSQIRQNQLSPRINATFKFDRDTTVHGGYASYFTPPPQENIPQGSVSQFVNTTGQATLGLPNDPVESERSHYFDLGVTHQFTAEYQVGLDGYYKTSQNTLDDGQFGAAPILSAFNYRRGQICGVELAQNYNTKNGFSAYGNLAVEQGIGTGWNSAQSVLFNASDYNYVRDHYIYLDHSQTFTGSFGVSYLVNETRPYLELITGSGFRTDIDSAPNGGSLPAYDYVNIGFEQGFKWAHLDRLSARLDVINVGDQIYELRSGSGVGVFAPQYGQRRSFYGGLKYTF